MLKTVFLFFLITLPIQIGQLPTENCGCERKPLPAVVATIDETKITAVELDTPIASRLKSYRDEVTEARKAELDLQINSILLAAEAEKRNISSTQLLENEVVRKTPTPTEADAEAFYNQNKAQIAKDFNSVKQDIITYLQQKKQRETAAALAAQLRAAAQVKVNVPVATPPATNADRARVFAVVNGKNITSGDIEDSLRPLIFRVQQQMYSVRKEQLEMMINDRLLEREAKKRGTTAADLVKSEIDAKTAVVSEPDALKFFNENKDRINGEFAQVKTQIIEYLIEQDKRKRSQAFANQLRANTNLQIFLIEPESPIYTIATDDQPVKGNPKALVTMIQFTDYQCPSCAVAHPIIERLLTEYGGRVRLVVRDFPMSQHKDAWRAAEAAEAAREQGKYWEYVALLYTRQSALQPEKLKQYATELGLDRVKFDAALDTVKFADKVRRDVLDGEKIGVDATPTVFVNGRKNPDYSYESLKAAIEAALKKPG